MKKIYTSIFLFFYITLNIFPGEYIYWEKEGKSPSGRISAHVRICSAKNYLDNKTANEYLNEAFLLFTNDIGQWIQGYEVTDVYLANGILYRIVFTWDYKNSAGRIVVSCGLANGNGLDRIYDSRYCYEPYNTFLEFYKKKCNEYLSML